MSTLGEKEMGAQGGNRIAPASRYLRRQSGGTLLGLIIGLIIGLSVAVVVAIMIKNTPLPFSNKVARPDKADPAASQISDPNRTLQGKGAAKEAATQFTKPAEPAAPGAETNPAAAPAPATAAAPGKPEPPREAARDSAKEALAKGSDGKAPVVDRSATADNKTSKADPAAAAADEKFTYYLQAGAFLEQADAENAKARLALMGVPASIAERKNDSGTLYRVRIGPFAQMEAMNRVKSKLVENGVDVAVVRQPK